MKFINWIKNLFAPKPLEPVQDGWKEMAARVSKKRDVEKLVKKVQGNIPPAPPAPPTRYIRESPFRAAPPMPPVKPSRVEGSNLDIMPYAYAYAVTHHYDDTPVRSSGDDTRSSFSSSFSSSDSGSSSSDSFSSGGGSFDGGGSSGDW